MLTHQAVVALWGEANIRTAPATVLDSRVLSQETKLLLGTVGVPFDAHLFGIILLDERSLRLPKIAFPDSPDDWYRIGVIRDSSMQICIHSVSGEVWCLVSYPGRDPFFMNSSVGALVKYLSAFQQNRVETPDFDENDEEWRILAIAATAPIERAWREIDSKALEKSDSCWSEILEELRSGVLG
jgi:hypothetical protein